MASNPSFNRHDTTVMSLLNNRGIGVFDEEDFEEEEILIPK
jgi:hypothetical protein